MLLPEEGQHGGRGVSRRQFLARAAASGVALTGLSLAACGTNDDARSAGKASSKRVVKLIHPSELPLVVWSVDYLAEDMGLYAAEGLTIKRVGLQGGPVALTGLLSHAGQADISSPGEMLASAAKGQGLKALMALTNRNASLLVVSKRVAARLGISADSTLEDKLSALGSLKGGRFAITQPGSLSDGLTRLALKRVGLDPASDAKIVPVQSLANSLAALQNDRVEGFIGSSPVVEQAILKAGAVPLLASATNDIPGAAALQGQTLIATAADVKADPDLFAAVVRANVKALRSLVEAPDKARDLLRRTRFADVSDAIWSLMWRNNQPSWGSPYITRGAIEAWVSAGLVGDDTNVSKFPYDEVLDMTFVDQAVKAIGWKPPVASVA